MKHILSLIACIAVLLTMVQYRVMNSDLQAGQPALKVTVWDAFGYYVYLPSILIYHDCTELRWLDSVDRKYAVTGGDGYQAQKTEHGRYVFKYLGGVALLELPLFLTAHFIALHSHYPADGFSPPYQYTLGFGIIMYCFFAILLLRSVLLRHFTDLTSALTILVLCLATNFLQYAAVDNGQSHAYIFPLYVLIMYTTLQWHRNPSLIYALLTGYIIGLATISRPTEAIMLSIPLLWGTQSKEAARAKWQQVKRHKTQVIWAAVAGLAGVLPQLIYWKFATGHFIYDVGSKWEFLSPHFRVLFGWEKGWFIYTPVTLLFVGGMLFIRRFPFRKSVLWFCLLNIYIIIAWHDWRYGGSYSTRALVQSYPVFALPFAAITERMREEKWRIVYYALCIYFLLVNLFQTCQYDQTILHFNDMNRLYYSRIYLNPHPTPEDMSMLDHDEFLDREKDFKKTVVPRPLATNKIHFVAGGADTFARIAIAPYTPMPDYSSFWLKINCRLRAPQCLWQTYLNASYQSRGQAKSCRVRLFTPISKDTAINSYAFYMHIPGSYREGTLILFLTSPFPFDGTVSDLQVEKFE